MGETKRELLQIRREKGGEERWGRGRGTERKRERLRRLERIERKRKTT